MPQSWQRALYLPLIVLTWLAVLLVAGWLLAHIARALLTLVLAAVLAYALTPLVARLARAIPRPLAIAVAYVLGFVVLLSLGAFIVATAATQVTALVDHLPQYARQAQRAEPRYLPLLRPLGITAATLHSTQQQAIAALRGGGDHGGQGVARRRPGGSCPRSSTSS